nr:DUF1353 domain-containing protein [Puniceicoccus vermicola]
MPLPLWFEFEGRKLTVWGGFKTDYASIPRGLWFLLAPRQIRRAAILHDAGYRILGFLRDQKIITNRQFSIFRETFDDLFFEAMGHVDPSISAFKRCAAFRSVRAFGWMRGAGLNDATIIQNNFPVVDRIISPF